MPRKPIETAAPAKRGHLYDKLGEPKPARRPNPPSLGIRVKGTGKGSKLKGWQQKSRNPMGTDKTVPPPVTRVKPHRATKAAGTWTPRKVGAPKGKPKPRVQTYTDEMISDALYQAKGLTYAAAQILGMDYGYLCVRVNKSPLLLQVRRDAIERRLDIAEITLDDLVATPGPSQLGATCFFLKCRGKERGYVERQEVAQTNAPVDLDSMNDEQLTALVDAIARKLEERGQ